MILKLRVYFISLVRNNSPFQRQTGIFFMSGNDDGETNSIFQLRNRGSSNARINVDNPVICSEFGPPESNATELE
jgi:hypothetical protein